MESLPLGTLDISLEFFLLLSELESIRQAEFKTIQKQKYCYQNLNKPKIG